MDDLSTFLEFPLDRDTYKPQKVRECEKPPLRILITEAGSKIAKHLMYKICSGEVFGPNQPLILHLVNAKGCINHRATLFDLEECGFPVLADSVVSSEPEKSYGHVDVAILIALFEELSGHSMSNAFLCQMNKTRNVVRNIKTYAKPNAKLILCSPSTKGVTLLLSCIRNFEPSLDIKNITGAVFLDEAIAKGMIAAELRTTTDVIKNLTIWGATIPDLQNATVRVNPMDDKSGLKVEIPLMKALNNQKWIHGSLIPGIFRRVMCSELTRNGGAVASAVAKHLKLLFQGTDGHEEIATMGVIVPSNEPFGLVKDIGFALPVSTHNGTVTVREDVQCSSITHLMNMRTLFNIQNDPAMKEIKKLIKYIIEFEEAKKEEFIWNQHTHLVSTGNISPTFLKCIISPGYEETISQDEKDVSSKKSITWEEVNILEKSTKNVKSVLRFNLKQNSV